MITNPAPALRAMLTGIMLAVASVACHASITVDAKLNAFPTGNGADSGVTLGIGQTFSVMAGGLWRNDPDPYFDAGPDGNTVQPALEAEGLTANFGTLVGRIGNGPFFAVGSSFTGRATTSGELRFFFWDVDSDNNSGTVIATVTVVPEPSSFVLMALGAALVTLRRRKT